MKLVHVGQSSICLLENKEEVHGKEINGYQGG
jgi:hypothetical protein